MKDKVLIMDTCILCVWLGIPYMDDCGADKNKWTIKRVQKKIDEIEYTDTTSTYHKHYYETKFKELKKVNRELYDSLKQYKDKIDYIVQFYHEEEYNTGQVHTKPNIVDSVAYDTIPFTVPPVAKTYEYTSEPNDTFQYKLNVNSFT